MDVDPLPVAANEDTDKCHLQQNALKNIWPLE